MANFVLERGLGNAAIREIGDHLRQDHAAHHWIERFRSRVYVHSSDTVTVALSKRDLSHVLEEVDDRGLSLR